MSTRDIAEEYLSNEVEQTALASHEDEAGLIGSVFHECPPDVALEAISTVPRDALIWENSKKAWDVFEAVAKDGFRVDAITACKYWRTVKNESPPLQWLSMCDAQTPGGHTSWRMFAEWVIEAYMRRRFQTLAGKIDEQAKDPSTSGDQIESMVRDFMAERHRMHVSGVTCVQSIEQFIEAAEKAHQLQGKPSGIGTRWRQINRMTGGFQYGEQTIIAARPSIGKTAIGMNVVHQACIVDNIPTLVVSLEMTPASLQRRLIADEASVPISAIRDGACNEGDFKRIMAAQVRIRKAPLWFVDGTNGITASKLAAEVMRFASNFRIKLVVIDYLQKVLPDERHEKRTYEVASVSGKLRAAAVQSKVAMVTLAQLNREAEADKDRKPRISDLADSGQIERDADCIIMIHRARSGEDTHTTELIIGKQRDGETGSALVHFEGRFCRFSDVDSRTQIE